MVISVLMKLAGGSPSFAGELNIDAFLEQVQAACANLSLAVAVCACWLPAATAAAAASAAAVVCLQLHLPPTSCLHVS